jgi:2-iminobutanoate/2-iminopropanoate deaminase
MNKKIINAKNAPEPIGPYSQAVMVGNTMYCSGQVAINPQTGELINEDLKAETYQVMKNLKAVLSEADLNFSNVVKCSIFLLDMNDFEVVNQVYGQYFQKDPPARETIQVARLPLDVNVEISLIAIK